MQRSTVLVGFLVSCALALPFAPALSAQADDTAAIKDLFNRYKSALLTGDGATAARLVDRETFAYFEEIKGLALDGTEDAVRQRPFVDRLLIVTMRHELPKEELQSMDLEGLLKHAIDAGWIGKQSIMGLGIGAITVNGDEATAVAITPTQSPGAQASSELQYRFVREAAEWRFGFRSLVTSINTMISQLTGQMGTDQDALIFVLVEQISGRKVLPEVWSLPSTTGAQVAPPAAESTPAAP
jgi:hypothetical protein